MLAWLSNILYFYRRKLSRSAIWDASPHATGMSMLYRSKWRQQVLVTPRRLYRRINLPCLAQAWPDSLSQPWELPTDRSDWQRRRLWLRLEGTPSQIRNHLCKVFLETEGFVTTHCSKSTQPFRGAGLYQHLPDSLQTGPRHGAPHLQLSILICSCDEKSPEGNPVGTTELRSAPSHEDVSLKSSSQAAHSWFCPTVSLSFQKICFWSRLETTVAPKNLKATTDWRNN